MEEPEGFRRAVEHLHSGFVRTERMSAEQEVMFFRRSSDTIDLVDLVAGVVQSLRPDCFPSPIMAVGDVVALGFDSAAAAFWRSILTV